MGTYIGHLGSVCIPEEKKAEFAERVLKILHQGGMFGADWVDLYGSRLRLLAPVYEEGDELARCFYNYYEDAVHETADFYMEDAVLMPEKVGDGEFNAVLSAVNILYEFYSEKFCIAEIDGCPFDGIPYVQWLNYLLAETYTNERVKNIWAIYELLPEYHKDYSFVQMIRKDDIPRMALKPTMKYFIEGCHFSAADLKEAVQWCKSKSTDDENTVKVGILNWLLCFCEELKEIYEAPGEYQKKLDNIIQQLTAYDCPKDFWECFSQENINRVQMGVFLPREVTVQCVTEVFGLDYHEAMEDWGMRVCEYENGLNKPEPFEPLSPMRTADFLEAFHCWSYAARNNKETYRITDDDRIYYWDGSDDVRLSDEVYEWMGMLREKLDCILEKAKEMDVVDVQERWVDALVDANGLFGNIYCFKATFYEILARVGEPEVKAAILLFEELVFGNLRADEEEDEEVEDFCMTKLEEYITRRQIKRYLALLGNPKLRKGVFGF